MKIVKVILMGILLTWGIWITVQHYLQQSQIDALDRAIGAMVTARMEAVRQVGEGK